MGRILSDQRTNSGITKTTAYTYNLNGSLATLTYPSGRMITYSYNTAARPISAVDVANSINYATSASYAPPGALSSLQNGASVVSTLYFNNRLQPCRISVKSSGTAPASCTDAATGNVLDFAYNFNLGAGDNGNVVKITNNRDTTRSINYSYDSLNRIGTAYTDGNLWGETFQIDAWANLNKILPYTGKPQPENLNQAAGANNRFVGMSYDAAGNLLSDGVHSFVYDAENHITTGASVTYKYDGDGRRVYKSNGKLYWYGTGTDPLNETDLTGVTTNATFKEYVFFGGKRIARRDSTSAVNYYFADHLGTARIVASSAGAVLDDSDFYPFGGERVVTSSSGNRYKFTGKERDSESGLDNFGARYYSSSMGRWATPDWSARPAAVPYAVLGNPQTLNLYSYVGNNPLAHADIDGHCWPAASCVAALNNALDRAVAKVQTNSLKSSPGMAAVKTFAAGAGADLVKMVVSPLTVGSATGTCMGGNGCSAGQTALAVGGDILKGAAIAGGLTAVAGKALSATAEATTTVTHFTNDAGVQAITDAGGVLRGGGQATGTFVAPASEIPGGTTSSQVEAMLEIGPGKGANSITFETPNSNLVTPGNGPTTGGGVTQFQLQEPVKIDPTEFTKTPQ